MQGQPDQRGSLSARLTSLFSPDAPAPKNHPPSRQPSNFSDAAYKRHSLDESAGWDNGFRAARTRPSSESPIPHARSTTMGSPNAFRPSHSAKSFSVSTSSGSFFGTSRPGPSTPRMQENPAMPMIRWLTGQSAVNEEDASQYRVAGPSQSNPPSPSAFSALDDALHDNPFFSRHQPEHPTRPMDMPSRPQAARLPPAFTSTRPPNYLSSLARSALPTACVSPLSPSTAYRTTYADPFDDPFAPSCDDQHNSDLDLLYSPTPIPLAMPHSPPQAHLTCSPPTLNTSPQRSSIDTLRSIQEKGKGIHTTSQQGMLFPNIPNPWKGWFTTENATDKENMDPFLDDRDKAASVEAQRERIRERCVCCISLTVSCILMM